jgi:Flp pilus assembly protein TadG
MLYRRNNAGRAARRGAAAAELAVIVAPVLAFVLVAGTDFARVFYSYLTITSCARNGALYGCQGTTCSTDTTGIQTWALKDVSGLSSTPGVSSSTGTDADGKPYVAVTVTYTFTTLVTYPGIPHTMNLSRTAQMRVVQSVPD